jgi:arabinose-5-phosphate isomerase
VTPDASITDALDEMSKKGMGMTAIVDADYRPLGIFTDGDLRRLLETSGDVRAISIAQGMSANPQQIKPEVLAVDAASIMDERRISQILVTDDAGVLIGAVNMHDLMTAKVI